MGEIKNTSIKLRGKEAEDFFSAIDFTPLKDFAKSYYGIEGDSFQAILEQKYVPIILWDTNIAELCGIFGKACNSVTLEAFSVGISKPASYDVEKKISFLMKDKPYTDEDIDAVYGEPHLWVTFDLKYETLEGGSNGITLFRADYSHSKGWSFIEGENLYPW